IAEIRERTMKIRRKNNSARSCFETAAGGSCATKDIYSAVDRPRQELTLGGPTFRRFIRPWVIAAPWRLSPLRVGGGTDVLRPRVCPDRPFGHGGLQSGKLLPNCINRDTGRMIDLLEVAAGRKSFS